jgi:hypothetical protein
MLNVLERPKFAFHERAHPETRDEAFYRNIALRLRVEGVPDFADPGSALREG